MVTSSLLKGGGGKGVGEGVTADCSGLVKKSYQVRALLGVDIIIIHCSCGEIKRNNGGHRGMHCVFQREAEREVSGA